MAALRYHKSSPWKQPQLSQPVLIREVLQPSNHFWGPPVDLLQQIQVLLVLGNPELYTALQAQPDLAFQVLK